MELVASLLLLGVVVVVWWLTAKLLKKRNWILRHLAASATAMVSLIFSFVIFDAVGWMDVEEAQKTEGVPTAQNDSIEFNDEELDQAFGTLEQKILDDFTPRMAKLVQSGLSMESLRHSTDSNDLGLCGDLMRDNQRDLALLKEDFSNAIRSLPTSSRFHEKFEYLHNAQANLTRCVTCLPTALPDCQEAAGFLRLNGGDDDFTESMVH